MDKKTMYTLNVYLKSGTVMTATVLSFNVNDRGVSWEGYGPSPLIWVSRDEIAAVVVVDEHDVEVEEGAKMFTKDVG